MSFTFPKCEYFEATVAAASRASSHCLTSVFTATGFIGNHRKHLCLLLLKKKKNLTQASETWDNRRPWTANATDNIIYWGLSGLETLVTPISAQIHIGSVEAPKMIPERWRCCHKRPLCSLNPCLIISADISASKSAVFLSRHPISLVVFCSF